MDHRPKNKKGSKSLVHSPWSVVHGPLSTVLSAIKTGRRFLVVSHYHPDGDALGSTLALGLSLKKLEKKVVMYNRDRVPYNLKYLPASSSITQTLPNISFDYTFIVDCAQPKRVSDDFAKALEAKRLGKLLCLDHHLLDYKVGDVDWIDPKAASTGCVIWKLLKTLKLHKNKDIANLVYCTLTVDTGSFRYSNTTADVFKMAGELLRYGADPWLAARNLEESNPSERYVLLGLALRSLFVGMNGEYASMDVTQSMLKESGAGDDLSEDFANYPRSIKGVEVSALFREMEDLRIKVSLRSKLRVDVSKVAKSFGGGGHVHAAGCILRCDLTSAKKQIETEVRKKLKNKKF
ncbi:MAG: DHH family phosphoesterase [Deltaproteobacteria bacterium]|nr:DHH family phosphoesterase [Deltaproteobacteria bacterium]